MNITAMIPIKLNSQRLPNKNILPLAGHPLCWHICNSIKSISAINYVYVYCSTNEVMQYLPSDISFLQRNKKFDESHVKGFEIYSSFINEIDSDIYILAHTTSPFIKPETIEQALNQVISGPYDSAFSAQRIQTFAWYNRNPINYDINNVPRTQDMEPIWIETSGFFIFKKEIFTKHNRRIGFNPYIAEVSRIEAIDIDEPEDYEFAKKIATIQQTWGENI